MGDPCVKVEELAELRAKTRSQADTLRGVQSTLEEISKLLHRIAEQGAEIKHLREDSQRNEKDIDSLFGRVRSLEIAPGRAASKVYLVGLTTAASCVGGTITGVMVFMMTKG